jgi:hypothetical protein
VLLLLLPAARGPGICDGNKSKQACKVKTGSSSL